MKKYYKSPEADIIEFNTKDVITTSGESDQFDKEVANTDEGWTGLY